MSARHYEWELLNFLRNFLRKVSHFSYTTWYFFFWNTWVNYHFAKRSFDIALIPLILSQSSWMGSLSWLWELFKVTLDTVEHNKHSRDHFHMHFVWLMVVVSYSFWSAFVFFFLHVNESIIEPSVQLSREWWAKVTHLLTITVLKYSILTLWMFFLILKRSSESVGEVCKLLALLSKGLKPFSAGLSMDF